MKKKILVLVTIFMLLGVILVPCVSATSLKEIAIEAEETIFFGRVSGMITNTGFPPLLKISGAKLELNGGLFKRITFSGILGMYRFNFVPFGPYTLTVSHPQYKTELVSFNLIPTEPFKVLSFSLYEKETRSKTTEERACLGSIYGNTGESYIWGFSPVGLVKVEAGGKSTISSPIMGFYKIRNLPLGTYTVTGTKKGYDTCTETVKLTEGHPDKKCFLHMEPNDENLKEKTNIEKIANEQIDEKFDSGKYGRVSGMVHTGGFPPYTEISGAKIVLEGDAINRITFSGILGMYRFNFLKMDRLYTLTVSHPKFKTQSHSFTVTSDKPHIFINFPMYEKNTRNTEAIEPKQETINNIESPLKGTIFGKTSGSFEHAAWNLPFVKIETYGKTVYSGLGCRYILSGLELGYTYEIIASKPGYYNRIYHVELTADKPYKYQNIDLMFNHEYSFEGGENTNTVRSTTNVNNIETACFGTILGKTGTYMWSGWCPINNVKVSIGTKTKYSKPHFFFTGLPLDKIYTVTASKYGWKTETREVTLTEENPIENIWFEMDDNGDNNVKTIEQNTKASTVVPTNKNETECMGFIHGSVGNSYGLWRWEVYPFALIDAEIKQTKCGPLGIFRMFLPLGTYNVTAYFKGYKSLTKKVTLTKESPDRELTFDFYETGPVDKFNLNTKYILDCS